MSDPVVLLPASRLATAQMWKAPSILVAIVLVLLALGIVMLSSSSSAKVGEKLKDPYYFLKRQIVWLIIALIGGMTSAFWLDYHWFRHKYVLGALMGFSLLGLLLVFVPGVGCTVNGAARWVRLGPVRIGQPSELAKFTCLVMLAAWMTYIGRRARELIYGLLIPFAVLSVFLVLILIEPDYGTTILIGAVGFAIMYAGGTKFSHLLVLGSLCLSGFILLVMRNPERARRIIAFANPSAYPDEAYQLMQSVAAFKLGGPWGVGLGKSLQKHQYLPEAHTDFILAIIGEELGIVATLTVVLLFVGLLVCGIRISMRANDMFGRLLGFGITTLLTMQAAINVAVVTGCMPTKGLPLPFISAGGSNLIMSLFGMGVLINIARHTSGDAVDKHSKIIKDRMNDS